MSLPGIIESGRRAAEARMTSRCTIRRKTGTTEDPERPGYEIDVYETVYADQPFRLAGVIRGPAQSRRTVIADVEVELALRAAHFPASTTNLRDGDLLDITSGDNAGTVVRIVDAAWQDQATARRVVVIEAQRPKEWS